MRNCPAENKISTEFSTWVAFQFNFSLRWTVWSAIGYLYTFGEQPDVTMMSNVLLSGIFDFAISPHAASRLVPCYSNNNSTGYFAIVFPSFWTVSCDIDLSNSITFPVNPSLLLCTKHFQHPTFISDHFNWQAAQKRQQTKEPESKVLWLRSHSPNAVYISRDFNVIRIRGFKNIEILWKSK